MNLEINGERIDRTFCVCICCSCPYRVSFNPPSTEHIINKNEKETRTILILRRRIRRRDMKDEKWHRISQAWKNSKSTIKRLRTKSINKENKNSRDFRHSFVNIKNSVSNFCFHFIFQSINFHESCSTSYKTSYRTSYMVLSYLFLS